MKRCFAFLVLLTLVPIPFLPGVLAQSTTYTEGFEAPDLNGDPPEEDWYTFTPSGTGQFRIATDRFKTGAQSYKQTETAGVTTGTFAMDTDLCDTGLSPIFKLWFNYETHGGTQVDLFDLGSAGTDLVSFSVGVAASSLNIQVNGDGSATGASITGIMAADTWFQVEVRFTDCTQSQVTVFVFNSGGTELGSVLVDDGGALTDIERLRVYADADSDIIWIDDIEITGAADVAATPIGSSATAAVTDLVGFDVDQTGAIAIARTTLGENVAIYNAQTLGTPVGGPIDTNCAASTNPKEDGVMAKYGLSGNTAQLVGFLNCEVGGGAEFLSIRQANGDVPTAAMFADLTGETCTPGTGATECAYNIDLSAFNEPADSGTGQIGQVEDFPIDYSNNEEELGFDNRMVAWAMSTQQCDNTGSETYCDGTEPGDVGLVMFTSRTDVLDSDQFNEDFVNHAAAQDVRDFCLGKDGGSYYLASVVDGVPGRSWPVTFTTGTASDVQLDATILSPASFGNSQLGVACGGGNILVMGGANTGILYTRTGVFLDEFTDITTGPARGVAISHEFVGGFDPDTELHGTTCTTSTEGTGNCVQYGVIIDTGSTQGVIVNLTGGSIVEVGRITLPGGTFKSVEIDRTAQNVWVATTTTIARFAVSTVTTIDPVSVVPGGETPTPIDTGDGLFAGSGASIGSAFGVGAFGGNLFLGALLMGIVAYGVGTSYGNVMDTQTMTPRFLRVNPWAAAIGAAIGFLVAWGFGFFSTAVVFSLVALVAMIVGIRLWTSRGG